MGFRSLIHGTRPQAQQREPPSPCKPALQQMCHAPVAATPQVLSFAGNAGLGGTLPPEFGDAETALPALQTLDVSGCGLTGTLPAQWGPGLQSLQTL